MGIRNFWLAALAGVWLVGCGNGLVGVQYGDIGPEGGKVGMGDTAVTVPAGALSSTTHITLTAAPRDQLPEGAAGAAVDLAPSGTAFAVPVKVQLELDPERLPDPSRADLTWVGTVVDGEWQPLADDVLDVEAGTVSATTLHFSRFGVVQGCGNGRRCPVKLQFVPAAQTIAAGGCWAAHFDTLDSKDRLSPVRKDAVVSLSSSVNTLAFYSDAGCTAPVTRITVPKGSSGGDFYLRATHAGSATVTASAPDLAPASQTETITAGSLSRLAFASPSRTVEYSACSEQVLLQLDDGLGNPTPVETVVAVTLGASGLTPPISFFSDAACTSQISTAEIPAGGARASFYFEVSTTAASLESISFTLKASASVASTSLTATQAAAVIPPAPAAPVALQFMSLPQTVAAHTCSAAVMVGVVDAQGNRTTAGPGGVAVNVLRPTAIPLYSDSACQTALSGLTIPEGQTSATFYFQGLEVGSYTLTAQATGTSLTDATQTETIVAGAPAALVFVSAPQTVNAGTCSAATTVRTVDAGRNPAPVPITTLVNLAAPTNLLFYSDDACTQQVPHAYIGGGQSEAVFFFKTFAAGAVDITASATNLASATQTETIVQATPTALVFVSAPQTVAAGMCSAAATVHTVDAMGADAPVPITTSVTLSASAATLLFYSDPACTWAVTSTYLGGGQSGAVFYFKSVETGTVVITASSTGLTPATQTETIN